MTIKSINGKKTAVINVFIDPENGFLKSGLTQKDGGVLYVPGGENVVPLMGDIVTQSTNSFFILGQDYHPANHISFVTNHPGVMEHRIAKFKHLLQDHHQPEPSDLHAASLYPVHFFHGDDQPPVPFPFEEVVLDENRNIIGLKEEDGRIRKVDVVTSSGLAPSPEDRGRISAVKNEYWDKTFDEAVSSGRLLTTQTLWTPHCVQGTESSLYPDGLQLPEGLKRELAGNLMSSHIHYRDAATGNEFFVIRKGADSEVDSYGIGVENDGETLTAAWDVFRQVAQMLKKQGCEQVILNIGGLATNFCVEFSANNIADFLAGHFKMRNMGVDIHFVPEISRGIPIPGGPEVAFSLAGTEGRLQLSRNIQPVTLAQVIEWGQAPDAAQNAQKPKIPPHKL